MARIIEESEFRDKIYVFRDRFHAGKLLARKLKPYIGSFSDPIILAIPSGGVPVGSAIVKELGGSLPMDLIIVRKIPLPYNPEAGFGSVSWDGDVILNKRLVYQLQLSDDEIESAIRKVKLQLNERMVKFRGNEPFPELKGRTAIIVDDGLASGYTMLSSIQSIKKYSPAGIIVAVPTASGNSVELVSPEVDHLFCLNIRKSTVFAVADAYQEWYDLSEHEVIAIIREYNENAGKIKT